MIRGSRQGALLLSTAAALAVLAWQVPSARHSALTAVDAYGDGQGNLLPIWEKVGEKVATPSAPKLPMGRFGYRDSQGGLLPVGGKHGARRKTSTGLESLSTQHSLAAGGLLHRGPQHAGVTNKRLEDDSHKISKSFPTFFNAAPSRRTALRNEAWDVQRLRLEREARAADAADDADAALPAEQFTPETKRRRLRGVV